MSPIMILPATCELCGNWLPEHSTSCARYGVHPSQWCLGIDEIIIQQEKVIFEAYVDTYDMEICSINIENSNTKKTQNKNISL